MSFMIGWYEEFSLDNVTYFFHALPFNFQPSNLNPYLPSSNLPFYITIFQMWLYFMERNKLNEFQMNIHQFKRRRYLDPFFQYILPRPKRYADKSDVVSIHGGSKILLTHRGVNFGST